MSEAAIYQIKVTLSDTKPPIWRRILVSGDTTLAKLHRILQVVMGWSDSHLHMFIIGEERYTDPDPYDSFHLEELRAKSEQRVKLSAVVPAEKSKFVYEYDFGDGWHHVLLVEKILPPDPEQMLPVCVKGVLACPPDDVGGIWGFYDFVDAINDPEHPNHEDMVEWYGEDFDPDAFDIEAVNKQLHLLR